ncbi:PREDICTED: nucleolar protein 12 [Ipomoea nil]|uniref:nucleolar protein 12 n=1 Tax=Ipomoea nil TaxID=35883 RepID=UPI000901213F|nr:PREDICTED: nucleolar protein 12 [Ipomoea nil]
MFSCSHIQIPYSFLPACQKARFLLCPIPNQKSVMAKKSKKPHDKESGKVAPNSDSSSIFQHLFGEFSENAATASIFSDENPFRRKPISSSHTAQQPELESAVVASDINDSEPKKRKKEKKKAEENGGSRFDNEGEEKDEDGVRKKLKSVETGKPDSEVTVNGKESGSEKKNKKKRKRDDVEAEYEAKLYGLEKAEKVGEKRKKMDNPEDLMVSKEGFDDESKLLRTVFVGNLPLKTKKKTLFKEFSKFGEIESIRIRSVPLTDSKVPRKGAVLKKQLNENADGVHAYIVFKTEESAHDSLALNMTVVGGNHIRVDRACPPRKKMKGDCGPLYDNKRTLFVGNLPFDVKDEEIYQLFCGIKNLEESVEAVRVIRDSNTLLGKGVAYVLFKTKEAVNLVVKKRLNLRDRELRLSHAKATATPSKRKNSNENTNASPTKKFAAEPTTPGSGGKRTEKMSLAYQGMRATKSSSSVQKKSSRPRTSEQPNSKARLQVAKKQTERNSKRPAVAARKAKALKNAAAPSKQAGTKRKLENRTPSSAAGRKKKLRKF